MIAKRLIISIMLATVSAPGLPARPSDAGIEITTLVPAADELPAKWRHTVTRPDDDWNKPEFDASAWKEGNGGFGIQETPGAIIGTTWSSPDIWLRREIELPAELPENIRLWIHYDEDPEVFINGVSAFQDKGWTQDYQALPITAAARAALKPGRNLIAIHGHQTTGGQYIDAGLVTATPAKPSTVRWSADRAWQWFGKQPLPIGFNYVPANSISYTEMWMAPAFDPALIDRELDLAGKTGFNCLRVVLPFVVWEAEPDAFKQRFERFLTICSKHGIQVMPCFFDDCVFGPITDPQFGKQPEVVVGWYANGWTPSPGHQRARDPKVRPALERYVKDVITAHRNDPRILCWDLYNEPSNSGMGNASLSLLKDAFRWAREIKPSQPVTSGIWGGSQRVTNFLKAESDIITFHNYQPVADLQRAIADLKQLGRPMICSEWLNRPSHSKVETHLPVFVREGVGAISWGLVNGRTQTDLPWGHKPGKTYTGPWQHDLFRPDLTPYDPLEIEWFKKTIRETSLRRN